MREDVDLLLQIEHEDLIAKEICYHSSCYKTYTSPSSLHVIVRKSLADEPDECPQKVAFSLLSREVEDHITARPGVPYRMSVLCDRYLDLLSTQGVVVKECRPNRLKSRLRLHFGNRLTFYRPKRRNETEFAFASTAEPGEIIEFCALELERTLKLAGHCVDHLAESVDTDSTDDGDTVDPQLDFGITSQKVSTADLFNVSLQLREDVLNCQSAVTVPPKPQDLTQESVRLPDSLLQFLTWLIGGVPNTYECSGTLASNQRLHRHVLSLGQDIMHMVTNGRVKTPKHVALPLAIKHMTGSVEAVSLLNRFGHGLSRMQLCEIETAMCLEQLSQQNKPHVYVPSNIFPGTFVTMCWDNIDFHEETLSGVTSHCTNGIVIQRVAQRAMQKPKESTMQSERPRKRPARSIPPPSVTAIDYVRSGRVDPAPRPTFDAHQVSNTAGINSHFVSKEDFLWIVARIPFPRSHIFGQFGDQNIPSWSGFNAAISSSDDICMSAVGYMPVITSSPTDLGTVYTLLRKSVESARELGQEEVVVVFDQAIYSKAQEMVWYHGDEFNQVVLRMGAFHTTCTLLATIGKRFQNSGLQDLMVESDLVGANSVLSVLSGKHYNRAMRAHKVVFEAIIRMQWTSFEEWLTSEEWPRLDQPELDKLKESLSALRSSLSAVHADELMALPSFLELYDRFIQYLHQMACSSPVAMFWCSYIEMVQLLLQFVRATRTGDWALHLYCVRKMLPWFFAYDRVNYARYLSVYWVDMMSLPDSHPAVHEAMVSGEFCVQRSHSPFAQVAVDQTIENTVNRQCKTKGGIVGFTRNPGAVQKWLINAHNRAQVVENCKSMAGFSQQCPSQHKEDSPSRKRIDEESVELVCSTLASWTGLFDHHDQLINISSGVAATEDVASDLENAYQCGNKQFTEFVEDRLRTGSVSFFSKLPSNKLKTFSSLTKTVKKTASSQATAIRADRNFFARALVVAQNRKLDLRNILGYSLTPVPLSLATVHGAMAKTAKSLLLGHIEKLSPDTQGGLNVTEANTTVIIDGMALLQEITSPPATFADLADNVFARLTRNFSSGCRRVDMVTDTYPVISIKNAERQLRSQRGSLRLTIVRANQKVPTQWKKYLADGRNKTELVQFFAEEWCSTRYCKQLCDRKLYLACGCLCYCFTSDGTSVDRMEIASLQSDHEEADTRLLLHASHAASEMADGSVVICTPDTDVVLLALTFCDRIGARVLVKTGHRSNRRCINCHVISQHLGADVCQALPGLHAFTGCDSTSAFVGKGKKKAFDLICRDAEAASAMTLLGKEFDTSLEVQQSCEKFVCKLYGVKHTSDVNEARYQMFCSKASQAEQLPPTKDALERHTTRANYQAAVWRRSLQQRIASPSPVGRGWLDDGEGDGLKIDWMLNTALPRDLLLLVNCGCKSGCNSNKCSCRKASIHCSLSCRCDEACQNRVATEINPTSEHHEEDSDSSGDEYVDPDDY